MTLTESINRTRHLAGLPPLSEAQSTALVEGADSELIDKIFAAALKFHEDHETNKGEQAPTKAGVRKWAKEYFKDNPGSESDPMDELVEAFFEHWDH